MLRLLPLVGLVVALENTSPENPCDDISTNCEFATSGGSKEFCTNSEICPYCEPYMTKWCRGTCSSFIEECGRQVPPVEDDLAFCFMPNRYNNDVDGDAFITNVRNTATAKQCVQHCANQFGCKVATHQGSNDDCFLYKYFGKDTEAEEVNEFTTVTPFCSRCHTGFGSFNMDPKDVIETVEGVRNMGKCKKKCQKADGCEYVQYNTDEKTCTLLKGIDAERFVASKGIQVTHKDCEQSKKRKQRAVWEVAGVSVYADSILVPAGAALAVSAVAAAIFVIKRKKTALDEPLLATEA